MQNAKKIMTLLLIVSMIIGLSACNNKDTQVYSMDLTDGKGVSESSDDTTSSDDESTGEVADLNTLIDNYFVNMPEHIYKIGQKDFVDKVIAGDDMVILDIRGADAYNEGHIQGAINVPWGPAIASNLTKIPQDKEVFVYCYTGQTAGQAVATMNIAGINARSVNLGWMLGISTVEGVDALTTTEPATFDETLYTVDSEVQTALDSYYNGLDDVKGTTFANYKISEDDLNTMIENSEDFYLLSIRGADAYDEGHIQGAKNIPFGNDMMAGIRTSDVPKDKKVVVYCYTGQTAGQAVAAMRLAGYDAVSLNGGMGMDSNAPHGWINHGYSTVAQEAASIDELVDNYFANMPEHIYKIGQKDFVDKIIAGDDMVILDIRGADAYNEGHIQGAINVPWGPAIATNLAKIPQDKEVFVYCYTGQTAGQAVATMNIAGINARSVNLGWMLGISTVEGVDALTTTEPATFDETLYTVDSEVQTALDSYYNGLDDVKGTTFANYKISEDDLNTMIENSEDFYLLSIRGADAYDEGHIQGAKNIPFGNDMMAGIRTSDVPKDKKVVVYCYTGQTAGQAVAAMRLAGYDAVSLNGGMGMDSNAPHGWINHGYSTVTE